MLNGRIRSLVMFALPMAALLGGSALTANPASAAPAATPISVRAGISSRPDLPALTPDSSEDAYLYDADVGEYVFAPDVNPDQAYFTAGQQTYFELELTSTTYDGYATYWLCSNGSPNHCLQDEDGPVDPEIQAETSGQFWFFVTITSGVYAICNYYWTVHGTNGEDACMYASSYNYVRAGYPADPFELVS